MERVTTAAPLAQAVILTVPAVKGLLFIFSEAIVRMPRSFFFLLGSAGGSLLGRGLLASGAATSSREDAWSTSVGLPYNKAAVRET